MDMTAAEFEPSRAELLAVVERSPTAAGAHDRAGWVGLFTTDGTVEDPVGSRPHRGRPRWDASTTPSSGRATSCFTVTPSW
jgi:hypothetical protein